MGRHRKDQHALTKQEVPVGTVEVAKRRIWPHLMNLGMVDYDLQRLCIDCWFQGAEDMLQTVITMPEKCGIVVSAVQQPVLDYQI